MVCDGGAVKVSQQERTWEDWANNTCYPITAPHWEKRGRYLRRALPPLTLTLCRSIWPTTDPSDPTVRKIVTVCMYDERNDPSMSPNSCYLRGGRAAKLRGCLHLLSGAHYVFDIVDRERIPPSFTEYTLRPNTCSIFGAAARHLRTVEITHYSFPSRPVSKMM